MNVLIAVLLFGLFAAPGLPVALAVGAIAENDVEQHQALVAEAATADKTTSAAVIVADNQNGG